jgi:hypothetical protein
MAKLTKSELARRTVRAVYYGLEEGDKLGDLVAQYGPDCSIEIDYGYYDEPRTYYIVLDRPETDEEYEKRIDELKALKEAVERNQREARKKREDDDRKTYERLKKKFEKS